MVNYNNGDRHQKESIDKITKSTEIVREGVFVKKSVSFLALVLLTELPLYW